jgi:uncharacterized protein (TIGR04255 family)
MGYPNLPHAPITEAVIDLRVILPAPIQVEDLSGIQALLGSSYPDTKKQFIWQGHVPAVEPSTTTHSGYYFWSADRLNVVQARLNGFSCSRMKPYLSWENLRDETRNRWNQYSKVARPERITRIAVRTINRIELPMPISDFDDYIKTFAKIAKGLPQELAGLYMRMVMPRETASAILTIAIDDAGITAERLPIIFDIDAFYPVDLPADSGDVWVLAERLREIKNQLFFGSLTPAAMELFR